MSSSRTDGPKLSVSNRVLDASALLALIFDEPGAEFVREVLRDGALMSTVNLSEVVARLMDEGSARQQVAATLAPIRLQLIDFDDEQAWQAGALRPMTRGLGLSLGDRACLSLALSRSVPAVTADRVWAQLDVGVEVVVCR